MDLAMKKAELLGPTTAVRVCKAVKRRLDELKKPGETYGICLYRILIEERGSECTTS